MCNGLRTSCNEGGEGRERVREVEQSKSRVPLTMSGQPKAKAGGRLANSRLRNAQSGGTRGGVKESKSGTAAWKRDL